MSLFPSVKIQVQIRIFGCQKSLKDFQSLRGLTLSLFPRIASFSSLICKKINYFRMLLVCFFFGGGGTLEWGGGNNTLHKEHHSSLVLSWCLGSRSSSQPEVFKLRCCNAQPDNLCPCPLKGWGGGLCRALQALDNSKKIVTHFGLKSTSGLW